MNVPLCLIIQINCYFTMLYTHSFSLFLMIKMAMREERRRYGRLRIVFVQFGHGRLQLRRLNQQGFSSSLSRFTHTVYHSANHRIPAAWKGSWAASRKQSHDWYSGLLKSCGWTSCKPIYISASCCERPTWNTHSQPKRSVTSAKINFATEDHSAIDN